MTEVNQTAVNNYRNNRSELFRRLSDVLPLRGSGIFDPGVSATLWHCRGLCALAISLKKSCSRL